MKTKYILMLMGLSISLAYAGSNYNNPDISSKAYSGALFTSQNDLTNKSSGYNTRDNNEVRADTNNSRLYSGAWYSDENKLTGKAGEKYNVGNTKKENNPNVSSLAYSGAQFKE